MNPEALAALHARAFRGPPRPWSAAEFAGLLAIPATVLLHERDVAFLLGRRAGPEAEILTLCTAPEARRTGCARGLLARFEVWAIASGIDALFLEVASNNTAARALYAAAGWTPLGMRRDYYSDAGRHRVHAHVLGKRLTNPTPGREAAPERH